MDVTRWQYVASVEEMHAFFQGCVRRMQPKARELGYALAVHGSMQRDLDVLAVPWADEAIEDLDLLARELQKAACGFEAATYQWERKPHGRVATSFCVCWPQWRHAHHTPGNGHVDLSVIRARAVIAKALGEAT